MTYRLIGTSTVPDEPAVMDKTGSGGSGGSGGASGGVTSASLSGIAPIATASTTVGASSGATSPQIGALLSSGVSFTTAATPGENISANLASPLSGLGAGLETGDVEVKARRRKACLIL